MPEVMPVKIVEEWDAEIKKHSLHLKFDSQLFFVEEMLEAKIPRVNRDLMEILFFPDSKRKEICENYIQAGEITNYFDLETPIPISLEDQKKIDDEYQHELSFYATKVSWLKDKLACCQKEMELRADRLVVRAPKGTVYYIDFDNGHDVDNDGSSKASTNGDGPFATEDKYTSIAAAGDIGKVRRGMTQAVSQDLAFANDGTIVAPCTMEADFDDIWGDETVAGETATLIFGSKTVTFANDISGDIAAGDWIYEATEDNREFAYEVATVTGGSNEIVTLYLPYKGNISGAGKTINIMPDNPIWNTAAGDFEWMIDGDHYWKFQGLHLRGTDGNGVVEIDSAHTHMFRDCIFEGNGGADHGIRNTDDTGWVLLYKSRFYNIQTALYYTAGNSGWSGIVRDSYFDLNNVAGSEVVFYGYATDLTLIDCETANAGVSDIGTANSTQAREGSLRLRNVILGSAVKIDDPFDLGTFNPIYSEDHNGTVGDNRQYGRFSTGNDIVQLQSEDTEVRGGGGVTSIKVIPSASLDIDWEFSRLLLFEYPIYAVKDVAKTYTAYLKSDDDTDWDADPLNTELWIEAEYWGHATNVHRKILKSTEVCNNFDADDTVWDTLTVTVTPLQTGVLYLRGYYCKTKEATNSNIFFCDTVIGVA